MAEMSQCPQCGSLRLFKDGQRVLSSGSQVQRYLCRSCGYRFTNEHTISKTNHAVKANSQVCELLTEESKNLATAELEKSAGEQTTTLDQQATKGLRLQFALFLEKEGYGEGSRYNDCLRMLLNSGADVYNPESVKELISKKKWKNGTKMQVSYAYDALTKMLKLSWTMPTYRQEETLPFIPELSEIDALISAARTHRLATYLQCLKETMADPTEGLRLKWTDITGNTITINQPVKNHNPRRLQVSSQLIAMLNMLPKESEYIFNRLYRHMQTSFINTRKKAAQNLQNPRLLSISLTTFRHFGATMLYAQTKDILLVKKLLGHKKIESTLKYTQLVNFKDSEYDCATATDIEEAKKLIGSGFEYVTEMNGIKLFRKPKRFVG